MLEEHRQRLLGGRVIFAMTGTAPTSVELTRWVESLLQMHVVNGYGSTEAGMVLLDGQIQSPPVVDYKLVDVPDLGYFTTDRPYPRVSCCSRARTCFPATTSGLTSPLKCSMPTATTALVTSSPKLVQVGCFMSIAATMC